jgi:hypothetical protein
VTLEECKLPLTWWIKNYPRRFPNGNLVAWKIFGIFGSQIEIEFIFNVAGF